jgi:hypothetical protein
MTKPKAILYSEHRSTEKDSYKKLHFIKENAMKKAKKDYTHITVILDRTGSMECIRDDIIGGFNAFLEEQQKLPEKATMTLVQFDSQDPYEIICRFSPVSKVPKLDRNVYVPRASTPLLDAIGRGINDLEASLGSVDDGSQPSQVVLAIVTDGQENASREFNRAQIVKMIEEKTKKNDWQFVFLSSDLDAIRDAEAYGIDMQMSLAYVKDPQGTRNAFSVLSKNAADYRNNKKKKMDFDLNDRKEHKLH